MKTLTDNLLHPRPTRFTLHASPFFRAAVAQEFPVDTCNPFMPNKPNFQPPRLTVTLDMIKAYNDNCPKKRKKNEPKTHKKRTNTNQNEPNPTPKTPSPNPIPPPKVFNFQTFTNLFSSLNYCWPFHPYIRE